MIATILGIAVFEGYWFRQLYKEELNGFHKSASIAFKDVVYTMQRAQLFTDTLQGKKRKAASLYMISSPDSSHAFKKQMNISIMTDFHTDSAGSDGKDSIIIRKVAAVDKDADQRDFFIRNIFRTMKFPDWGSDNEPIFMSQTNDSLHAPVTLEGLDSNFRKELRRNAITVPYVMREKPVTEKDLQRASPEEFKLIAFLLSPGKPSVFEVQFENPFYYLLGRLKLPLAMGLLLLGFTTLSLVVLYRNLLRQQQLGAIKNEFISNMTHELKTPISTVKVAVEALRHFDALDDPQKTREYLDISAMELQRLSMLVDKVLKLSLFENKEIELNKTTVDVYELAAEVIASMKLQLDKVGAFVQLAGSPEAFIVKADRAHLSSVLSNLLDNALKYSKEAPAISVQLSSAEGMVVIVVSDNGIGIPAAYVDRIFEKFFRVPYDDHHNIKGYGLGLSYVQHIVVKHNGSIVVESKEGKGSSFTIKLPAA